MPQSQQKRWHSVNMWKEGVHAIAYSSPRCVALSHQRDALCKYISKTRANFLFSGEKEETLSQNDKTPRKVYSFCAGFFIFSSLCPTFYTGRIEKYSFYCHYCHAVRVWHNIVSSYLQTPLSRAVYNTTSAKKHTGMRKVPAFRFPVWLLERCLHIKWQEDIQCILRLRLILPYRCAFCTLYRANAPNYFLVLVHRCANAAIHKCKLCIAVVLLNLHKPHGKILCDEATWQTLPCRSVYSGEKY